MATIESSNTNSGSVTGSGTNTITKPTGLAVGDQLLALVSGYNASSFSSYTTPSGWTLEGSNTTDVQTKIYAFSKTADSSDVAASNFDFAFTGAGGNTTTFFGELFRISSWGNNQGTSIGGLTTIDPTRSNCLFIYSVIAVSNAGVFPNVSGYAMATDNPTWTERTDLNANTIVTFELATATRTAQTDTGVFSHTVANVSENQALIIAIAPKVNSSKTSDIPNLVSSVQNAVPNLIISSTIEQPSITMITPQTWTTTLKS